jgi:hypothetical protein
LLPYHLENSIIFVLYSQFKDIQDTQASENTVLPPTRRQKPSHKKPNGGGYAAAQTFCEIKKKCRSSIEQKEVN